MKIKKDEIKRKALNYRQVPDGEEHRSCTECTHKKKISCVVLDGPVYYDSTCDAWNDKKMENTWTLFVHTFEEKFFVLVKDGERKICQGDYDLQVKSVDAKMMELFTMATLKHGCPDFVCNISPRVFNPVAFRKWLEYRSIFYVENDLKMEQMKINVGGEDFSPLEVLSMMVDAALMLETGGKPGNGK